MNHSARHVDKKVLRDFDESDLKDTFYVYLLSYQGTPFYVGKGKGNRWRHHFYEHSRESNRHINPYKQNKIDKILRNGGKVEVSIVFKSVDEQECFDEEKRLIAKYKRKCDGGPLTNFHTNGEPIKRTDHWSEEKFLDYRESMTENYGWAPIELVKKAKVLYHYRGLDGNEIANLEEFDGYSPWTIRAWICKNNRTFHYVLPHLHDKKELIEEKRNEVTNLFYSSDFSRKQIADILGLKIHFVDRTLKGLKREEQSAGGTS